MNYLVFSDSYPGSALDQVGDRLAKDILAASIPLTVLRTGTYPHFLKNGKLDDPDHFAQHQLRIAQDLLTLVQSDDRVLFVDFFQPTLPFLRYVLDGKGTSFKCGSLFHGASFIVGDAFEGKPGMPALEDSLFELMDTVYVPSEAAQNVLPPSGRRKAKVAPFPFNTSDFQPTFDPKAKRFDVVVPGRWSHDRGSDRVAKIIRLMSETKFLLSEIGGGGGDLLQAEYQHVRELENVFLIGEDIDYVLGLGSSKVVLGVARQELFGYGIREAMASGCVPVLYDIPIYRELAPLRATATSVNTCVSFIQEAIVSYPWHYVAPPSSSSDIIIDDFFLS